tara:strand:- start:96 stop:1058 length:963 start_codon:yes stop_codon:yes gene_type:complete
MKKNIAIIAGEPFSINSEIIAKSWRSINKNERKNIFVIGNFRLIKKQLERKKIKIKTKEINDIKDINSSNNLQIFNIHLNFKNPFKIKEKDNSKYVLKCLDTAHNFAKNKKILGFINAPIDKKIFKSKYPGVTEYLAKKNNLSDEEVMLLYNKELSVVPITTHLDLREVSKKLKSNLIQKKIKTLNKFYITRLNKKPKIAVLGLNPHNSEGKANSEEKRIIIPVVNKLKKKINIKGPFPADTLFMKGKKSQFDVIVGMYHDQVLAPFKALYNFNAINITLGLNYIRISPDHGTGKDIVYLNKANPMSLIQSLKFFKLIKK